MERCNSIINAQSTVKAQETSRRFGDVSCSSRALKHVIRLYMSKMLLFFLLLLIIAVVDVIFSNITIHEMFQRGDNGALTLQLNCFSLCGLLMI